MKIKDLIKELNKFDENLPVDGTVSLIEHFCGDDECRYCSSEEVPLYLSSVAKKLDQEKRIVGVSLNMEKS